MATTTNFGLPLIGTGERDPYQKLAQILNALDALLARLQRPEGVSLAWGDVAAGSYIEATGSRIVLHGPQDFAGNQAENFVLHRGTEFPDAPATGQLFFRTDESIFYYFDGADWVPISALTGDALDALGGLTMDDYGEEEHALLVAVEGAPVPIAPSGDDQVVGIRDGVPGWYNFSDVVGHLVTLPGDMYVGVSDGTFSVLPIVEGAPAGYVLTTDAEEATLMRWAPLISLLGATLAAKGDFVVGDGSGGSVRLQAPANGRVLVRDSDAEQGWSSRAINSGAATDLVALTGAGTEEDPIGLPAIDGSRLTAIPDPTYAQILSLLQGDLHLQPNPLIQREWTDGAANSGSAYLGDGGGVLGAVPVPIGGFRVQINFVGTVAGDPLDPGAYSGSLTLTGTARDPSTGKPLAATEEVVDVTYDPDDGTVYYLSDTVWWTLTSVVGGGDLAGVVQGTDYYLRPILLYGYDRRFIVDGFRLSGFPENNASRSVSVTITGYKRFVGGDDKRYVLTNLELLTMDETTLTEGVADRMPDDSRQTADGAMPEDSAFCMEATDYVSFFGDDVAFEEDEGVFVTVSHAWLTYFTFELLTRPLP